jgi:hypothetical protein
MSNSSNAARHINQYSQDSVAYLAQNYTELVIKPDLAIPNNDSSHWTPGSSIFHPREMNQQPPVGTCDPFTTDLYFTLPAVIAEGLEHILKTDASPTTPIGRQELFIQNHENHIADLMKANNDLEQEIAALEESWICNSDSDVLSDGLLALAPFIVGASLAVAAFGALFTTVAAAPPPHRAVAFDLPQRTELREKLSNTRSALEKARAELKTAKEELECLQAARDLEADLPSLQREVDRELEFAFQKISI